MAPSALVPGSGLSATPIPSSGPAWHVLRRASSSSSSSNSTADGAGYQVLRISPMMNERGDFNGTCTKEEVMTITPETPDGSCSSYFADVTDYCCAAVGGIYNATFQAVGLPDAQAMALDHPICATSNYADSEYPQSAPPGSPGRSSTCPADLVPLSIRIATLPPTPCSVFMLPIRDRVALLFHHSSTVWRLQQERSRHQPDCPASNLVSSYESPWNCLALGGCGDRHLGLRCDSKHGESHVVSIHARRDPR